MTDINNRIAEFCGWSPTFILQHLQGEYGLKIECPAYDSDPTPWPEVYAALEKRGLAFEWEEAMWETLGIGSLRGDDVNSDWKRNWRFATATPAQRADAMERVLDGLKEDIHD